MIVCPNAVFREKQYFIVFDVTENRSQHLFHLSTICHVPSAIASRDICRAYGIAIHSNEQNTSCCRCTKQKQQRCHAKWFIRSQCNGILFCWEAIRISAKNKSPTHVAVDAEQQLWFCYTGVLQRWQTLSFENCCFFPKSNSCSESRYTNSLFQSKEMLIFSFVHFQHAFIFFASKWIVLPAPRPRCCAGSINNHYRSSQCILLLSEK